MNYAPLIRIFLRVFGGVIIGFGLADDESVNGILRDPQLDEAIGVGVVCCTELWYFAAKKFGWQT